MELLAASDNMGVLNLVVNGLLTLAVAYLGYKAKQVSALEEKLSKRTDEAVLARFQAHNDRCTLKHQQVEQALELTAVRLARGDGAFESNRERNHELEVKLANKIDTLKDWIRENCASKHEVENLGKRFDAIAMK